MKRQRALMTCRGSLEAQPGRKRSRERAQVRESGARWEGPAATPPRRKSAADPWSRRTARCAPCRSSLAPHRAPWGSGWPAAPGAPAEEGGKASWSTRPLSSNCFLLFLEVAPSSFLEACPHARWRGPELTTGSFVQRQLPRPSEPSRLPWAGDRAGGDVLPPILVLIFLPWLCFLGVSTHRRHVLLSSLLAHCPASFPTTRGCLVADATLSHPVAACYPPLLPALEPLFTSSAQTCPSVSPLLTKHDLTSPIHNHGSFRLS